MRLLEETRHVLHLARSHGIARRYFVVNGFDGALAMLGLVMGFYVTGDASLEVAVTACMGGAVALGVSGLSSAYISESAERRRDLRSLEEAMAGESLHESSHGRAARLAPLYIAAVNGLAPFVTALLIIAPLWLVRWGLVLPVSPFAVSAAVATFLLFLYGVYLGVVSGTFWLWSGVRTLLIAAATAGLILLLRP
jgi:predicted membrane protein (TIGR00267 family)